MADTDDWNPVTLIHPSQPQWDTQTINENSQIQYPGSSGQWDQEDLTPTGDSSQARLHDSRTPFPNDSDDYLAQQRGDMANSLGGYNNLLDRANKTIANRQRHEPDPFLEDSLPYRRPFSRHSRFSSVESISSIIEEKTDSPLNKAIASV
jgi:alpha-1,3-glucan synthase